ncbi:MAG: WecB/TagA/CpsF family glycosyltransferase [Pseudomonadota bacterium]
MQSNHSAQLSSFDVDAMTGYPIKTDFQRKVVCILGLPFDVVSMQKAVDKVVDAAQNGERCFLSTPNLNFAVASLDGGNFRDSVIRSDLSLVDGMPLVWIARLLGLPVRERVAGSSLFEKLREQTKTKLRVYFFGGPDGVAETAEEKLNIVPSGLTCVGHDAPGFGSVEQMSSREIINRINASQPDFLVVALGAKKGQAWIEHNLSTLHVPVISHLGAVVNFVAGTVVRAPIWVRRLGFEWLWRIKEEPALWRRYFHDGLRLFKLMALHVIPCAVSLRLRKSDMLAISESKIALIKHGSHCTITASGAWSDENLSQMRQVFSEATASRCDIRIDFSEVTQIDSACIALLMLLYGHQSKINRDFILSNVQPDIRRLLRMVCADYLVAVDQTVLATC